jgi:hypothetical protein
MKLLRLLFFLILLITGSCFGRLDNYVDEVYTAPCRVVVRIDACGVNDIGHNLTWLSAIILTSMDDQTGNYLGKIWCKNYNGQDYIVTDMPLGSGGVAYHTFTCDGQEQVIDDEDFFSALDAREIVWISYCVSAGTGQ